MYLLIKWFILAALLCTIASVICGCSTVTEKLPGSKLKHATEPQCELKAELIIFDQQNFRHIKFKRITPNTVNYTKERIIFQVNQTASFLVCPFNSIHSISHVFFQWKAVGQLKKLSVGHEASREGDDAWIRVGLILKSKTDFIDPIGPRWIRQTMGSLNFPADKMIFLIPEAKHAPGEIWLNPYSRRVKMIALGSTSHQDGWRTSEYHFARPEKSVGILLMADGDNTKSTFTAEIKNLFIEYPN